MQPKPNALLCRYHYDPLDRLVEITPRTQATAQRFYQKERLATESQGTVQRSIMQHDNQLLAQQQRQGNTAGESALLATDWHSSVLNVLGTPQLHLLAYTPYGHCVLGSGLLSLLGFNGQPPDPVTGHFHLGNGYRQFNPVLMRFNGPDNWSPFGQGGLNTYAYCKGDPINYSDPTGHMRGITSLFRKTKKLAATAKPAENAGNIKNISRVNNELHTFENNDGSKLTIVTHGNEQTKKMYSDGKLWAADDLLNTIDVKKYDRVRILACHSDEVGAEIALKTNKKVKAYIGEVTTNLSGEILDKMYYLRRDTKNPTAGNFTVKFTKENPHNPETHPVEHSRFNYQPVRFIP